VAFSPTEWLFSGPTIIAYPEKDGVWGHMLLCYALRVFNKMKIINVQPGTEFSEACLKFLAADVTRNFVVMSDLVPPLSRFTKAYASVDDGNIRGVGTIFRGFSIPSLVVAGNDESALALLLETLVAQLDEPFI